MTRTHTPTAQANSRHEPVHYFAGVLGALLAMSLSSAQAAETSIANEPLITRPTVQAKPNLMFILDDSGSMSWDYMPDYLGSHGGKYGFFSSQCNGSAYNPDITYAPPKKADGTNYPAATFSNAKDNGYVANSNTTNLRDRVYYTYTGSLPALSWSYSGTSSTPDNTPFRAECITSIPGNGAGNTKFTRVTVTSASAEAQNYANWYSYYRARFLLMRTALGRALSDLDDSYRIGFMTINNGSRFLDVKDFDATQKSLFYSNLYESTPSGSTPLRPALAKAGQYFAKKARNQTYDPMQYSCQRNYALLSTDGYWNGAPGTTVNGGTIGQQDGTEARPMRDDANSIVTTIATYTRTTTGILRTTGEERRYWERTLTVIGPRGSCRSGQHTKTIYNQKSSNFHSRTTTALIPQQRTDSYTVTTTSTNGVNGAPVTSTTNTGNWTDGSSGATSTTTVGATPSAPSAYTNVNSSRSCVSNSNSQGSTPSPDVLGAWASVGSPSSSVSDVTTGAWGEPTSRSTTQVTGGTPETLADVAQYYWATDLRTAALGNCTSNSSGNNIDVCSNILKPTQRDPANWQHMNTFSIGLGVNGSLAYDRNYLTQTSGTYVDLTSGAINWPEPESSYDPRDGSYSGSSGGPTNIDDLWHSAVNGRGVYYSALNADALREAISGVVTSIQESMGSASAASTNSLELVSGDNNRVYLAKYRTASWVGDIEAYSIDGATAVIASTPVWSAQAILDRKPFATRSIYFNNGGSLAGFEYANLGGAQRAYFSGICNKSVTPSQCAAMTGAEKTLANDASRLIDYLRGDRTYEVPTGTVAARVSPLYRQRTHVLGDIINGAPIYVGKPPFSYADNGYASFVTAKANRKPVVYAAANDGMLHAFSADTSDGGAELWSFIPTPVMPNLYKLANAGYGNIHEYFADGAPVMGDIKVGGAWKTILVAGLNSGGKGYYALDITNPLSPQLLWEFTNVQEPNLGLSYGNPIITKRADGTWIVALTSGYNNGTEGGNGKGHLYILNASTGTVLKDIETTAGTTTTPSGLGKINAWVDSVIDNRATRFYGGDLMGNVWRFDIDNLVAPNGAALKLAALGTDQSITVKPLTAELDGKPVVIVGTGRYLGEGDISTTTQQSVYAIKDPLTNSSWGDVRSTSANFVEQTLTVSGTNASVSNNALNWNTNGGWWIDLPNSKERIVTPMALQLTTLVIGTAIPSGDACVSGGASWRYFLNLKSGSTISGNPVGTQFSPNVFIAGPPTWVKDSDGNLRVIFQGSDGTPRSEIPPVNGGGGSGRAHRTSWRELVN